MKKVLIVEDDSMLAEIYQKKFEKIGSFSVIRAASGTEAIDKAKAEKPDLILLDLVLPEMDGFDVLAEMRKIKSLDDTKIVPFSNLSQEDNKKKLEEAGADGFISKSEYTPQQLVVEVEKLLKNIEIDSDEVGVKIKHKGDVIKKKDKSQKNILIIDDEEVFLDVFGGRLKEADFSVDTALSGKEGARFLSEDEYDVVILNVALPDIEAKRIVSEFKLHFPKVKTNFILLRSEADLQKDIDELKKIGVDGVINKDKIEPDEFAKEIKNVLK